MWCAIPTMAWAGGPRRVPDLRRDTWSWADSAHAGAVLRLPVTVHLAVQDGSPVTDRRLVERWVERANLELAVFGIVVEVVAIRRLPSGWAEVTRRQRRRDLARYAPRDGTIHVFGVGMLDEGTTPTRIRGMHWRYRGWKRNLRGREYVVVARGAPDTTLVHELGHLFGLGHARAVNNIMCSCRDVHNVGFTWAQGFAMRQGARRFLARQVVSPGLSAGLSRISLRRR